MRDTKRAADVNLDRDVAYQLTRLVESELTALDFNRPVEREYGVIDAEDSIALLEDSAAGAAADDRAADAHVVVSRQSPAAGDVEWPHRTADVESCRSAAEIDLTGGKRRKFH